MSRKRWRRERWISVVEEFEQSGLTQREFARRRRLNLGTLRSWIYKLRRAEDQEETPLRFVEITGAESPTASSGSASLGWPRGPQIVFNELPTSAYLAALLRSLMDPPGC